MVCEVEGLMPGPAELLWREGWLPGFIGLYQFDVRLPLNFARKRKHVLDLPS